MKLPRDVEGRAVVKALCANWGYVKVNQVGSHIILQTEMPQHHRISVPDHKPLRLGTLNAILREVASAQSVSKEAILASM